MHPIRGIVRIGYVEVEAGGEAEVRSEERVRGVVGGVGVLADEILSMRVSGREGGREGVGGEVRTRQCSRCETSRRPTYPREGSSLTCTRSSAVRLSLWMLAAGTSVAPPVHMSVSRTHNTVPSRWM